MSKPKSMAAQWGKGSKATTITVRGMVKRPGIGDLPYVEIQLRSHGTSWAFECAGSPALSLRSAYTFKSEAAAKRAAELAANMLLDLRVALAEGES